MAKPDFDVATLTRDLIDNNWDTNNTSKPEQIKIRVEESDGQPRKRHDNPSKTEYVHVLGGGEMNVDYQATRQTRDIQHSATVILNTPDSRSRFFNMFDELDRILDQASRRIDNTPDDWDTLDVSYSGELDQTVRYWQRTATLTYKRHAIND